MRLFLWFSNTVIWVARHSVWKKPKIQVGEKTNKWKFLDLSAYNRLRDFRVVKWDIFKVIFKHCDESIVCLVFAFLLVFIYSCTSLFLSRPHRSWHFVFWRSRRRHDGEFYECTQQFYYAMWMWKHWLSLLQSLALRRDQTVSAPRRPTSLFFIC